MRRIARIATTFAIVLVVYWGYALAVVPLIEPPAGHRYEGAPVTVAGAPVDRLAGYRRLFAPTDWELEEKTNILEGDQVKLLVQQYNTIPGTSQMELRPCTIIFIPKGALANDQDQARQAIVLQSPDGATLQFDKPIDLRRGTFGELKAGRMPGRITVRSGGTLPGPEDDLYLVATHAFAHGNITLAELDHGARLIQPEAFDWSRVLRSATAFGCQDGVYVYLRLLVCVSELVGIGSNCPAQVETGRAVSESLRPSSHAARWPPGRMGSSWKPIRSRIAH